MKRKRRKPAVPVLRLTRANAVERLAAALRDARKKSLHTGGCYSVFVKNDDGGAPVCEIEIHLGRGERA